jgi:hypothetical protein
MTRSTICEGDWRYTKPVWFGTFTARNAVTGDTHDTGALDLDDARLFIALLTPPASATTATYTIASGPQRARGGHQRFPHTNHFE